MTALCFASGNTEKVLFVLLILLAGQWHSFREHVYVLLVLGGSVCAVVITGFSPVASFCPGIFLTLIYPGIGVKYSVYVAQRYSLCFRKLFMRLFA